MGEMGGYRVWGGEKGELEDFVEEGVYEEEMLSWGVWMVDVVEKYEGCEVGFEGFVEVLRGLKRGYYWI